MLQALLHNKLGRAISDGYFSPTEDSLTSSTFGVLQYLPDNLVFKILEGACGLRSSLPKDVGRILSITFWPQFGAEGTHNSVRVEPDVWIECDACHILIEAKKIDDAYGYAQSEDQWFNEIKSLKNEVGDGKKIILIALGGNDNLYDAEKEVDGENYTVYTASWFNLLDTIEQLQKELIEENGSPQIRILGDCIKALSEHGYFKMVWFEDFCKKNLCSNSINIIHQDWGFDNLSVLGKIKDIEIKTSAIEIKDLWKIE